MSQESTVGICRSFLAAHLLVMDCSLNKFTGRW